MLGDTAAHAAAPQGRTSCASTSGYLPQDAAATLPPDRTVAEIVAEPILERDRRYNRTALADAGRDDGRRGAAAAEHARQVTRTS